MAELSWQWPVFKPPEPHTASKESRSVACVRKWRGERGERGGYTEIEVSVVVVSAPITGWIRGVSQARWVVGVP